MDKKQTQLRMPVDIYHWLTVRARCNSRSMNGELLDILKKEKEADEQKTNADE